MKITRILTVGMMIASILLMTVSISSAQGSVKPAVLPPTASVQGRTLGEWHGLFSQQYFSIPEAENPYLHPGPNCYFARIGNVGLAPAGFESGSSDCQMPVGMMLYVLVVGSECSTVELPTIGGDEKELRACALNFVPDNLEAFIDGNSVRNIGEYTALSPLYELTLLEGNLFRVPPGTADSVAFATGFLLTPLSPGEHTVHVHGEIPYGNIFV
jgi:hypothetical protein